MGVGFLPRIPISLIPPNNDVRDAGVAQRIDLESRERVDASAVCPFTEYAIAADAGVQDAHLQRRWRLE